MITQETYDNLKTNVYFLNYKNYLYTTYFDELMIQMLIKKEKSNYYDGGTIPLIKELRDETPTLGLGLRDLANFTHILRDLEIIDTQSLYISDYIYIINSLKDVIYMIDNRMDIKQYSRYHKLNKLKSNIINKV